MTFHPLIINITPSKDVISLGLNVCNLPLWYIWFYGHEDQKCSRIVFKFDSFNVKFADSLFLTPSDWSSNTQELTNWFNKVGIWLDKSEWGALWFICDLCLFQRSDADVRAKWWKATLKVSQFPKGTSLFKTKQLQKKLISQNKWQKIGLTHISSYSAVNSFIYQLHQKKKYIYLYI